MNAVHSLWTGTPQFRLDRGVLLIHTLSLALAHEHFTAVELVTDVRGLQLAETLGWRYTSYLSVLDRLTSAGLTHVWALGKLAAIQEQSEPFVHLDGDVLLNKTLRREIRHARLCAQSIDYPDWYIGAEMQVAIGRAGMTRGRVAYNCGVIGGTDLKLLHDYAAQGTARARQFLDHPLNGTTVSMAIEQYHLADFARRNRTRVETVLPLNHSPADYENVGYQHYHGGDKRDPSKVAACEERLARQYPQEYARFVEGWSKVGNGASASPTAGSAA